MQTERPTPRIVMRQRDNTLKIYCPSPLALKSITEYLTFTRTTWKRDRGKCFPVETPEQCYRVCPSDPFVLTCPAGFETMITDRFATRFSFEIRRSVSARISQRTQPDWSRVQRSEFRPGQFEMLQAMAAAERGRIVVPPAVGKMFLIIQYAKLMPKARIVVSTHYQQVLLQIYEGLQNVFGDGVGLMNSKTKKNPDARILCVSQGTFHRLPDPKEGREFDVLIVDEYHEWGSEARLAVLESVGQAKMFGMSANKERNDKADFRLNGIFGPILSEMSYAQAVERNLVTPICVVWLPIRDERDPTEVCLSSTDHERFGIWRYDVRNRSIANAARMFGEDEQVLIFVKTREHALYLKQHYLPEYTVVYAPVDEHNKSMNRFRSTGLLNGIPPMTPERLLELKHQFSDGRLKKVIATKVWGQGMNFNQLSVLIRADGMDSVIADTQLPGRTSRLNNGKSVSLVFDCTDEHHYSFWMKALKRQRRYQSFQWRQITLRELQELMG